MFSGSYVAIVTPMRADGSVDFDAWSRLLEFHVAGGTRGIVVGGTTGESATLVDGELRELVVRARDELRGRAQLLAGAGTSSTATTIERAAWLGDLGLDALLVVTPAYNKPTQEGLFLHYQAVAAASAVPVVLYNVPGRTAVDMLPQTVARLSRLPRIVGLKEAVADLGRIRELTASCAAGFDVLSGDDASARDSVLAGARGVISVTANVAPRWMSELMAAALAGRASEAATLDAKLAPLHERLFLEANPIPVKWVLQQMNLIEAGIRLPLTPLSTKYHERLRDAMRVAAL